MFIDNLSNLLWISYSVRTFEKYTELYMSQIQFCIGVDEITAMLNILEYTDSPTQQRIIWLEMQIVLSLRKLGIGNFFKSLRRW